MFQSLVDAKQICVDLETNDPDLKTKGCGAQRNGTILGVAIGTDTGIREYYPLTHIDQENNINPEKVFSYLRQELSYKNKEIVGANILYDLEYLAVNTIKVQGKIVDIQIAEPLIDENLKSYSLETLAQKYLGESKKIDEIEEECKRLKLKGDPRAHLWKFASSIVRPYAIGDVDLPLKIYEKQKEIIKQQELSTVFDVELRLLPLLLKMKLTGCRIDVMGAYSLKDELVYQKNKLKELIESKGLDASTSDAGRQKLKVFFEANGLEVPYTKKTNKPSFTSPYLQGIDKEEIKWIVQHKQLEKFIGTFLESQIIGMLRNDRIHAQFNSLRDSQGGTVTGRFSSSRPNLQNIPARNSALAPRCRGLFIPEEGHLFGSIDYSQIEYRILCHFALGRGAKDVQKAFNDNPNLDIHQWCADIAGISRSQAKNINFGIIYGQGVAKTARVLNLSLEDAKAFLKEFNSKMPFAKYTAQEAMARAENRGWVKTILGRRRRFNLWEPAAYDEIKQEALPFEEAKEKWGENIKRAHAYKALNSIVQGSSADLLKLAMVKAHEQGLLDVLVPLTTVHDELNVSVPQTKEGKEAFKELVHVMETCYSFRVPIIAEAGLGKNWSEAK